MLRRFYMIPLFLACLLMPACKKNRPGGGSFQPGVRLLMLRVDYMTGAFEGGLEMRLDDHGIACDTLPLQVRYVPPSDFGNLTVLYEPTKDTIFDGSIIWMGRGSVRIPRQMDSAATFSVAKQSAQKPDSSSMHDLLGYRSVIRDTVPWHAVSKLAVVQDYLVAKKRIDYFLYTPSVGSGNPYEWDWYLVFGR